MLTEGQSRAIEKLSRLKVGALFMRMGTGKTRAAIELANLAKPDFLLYVAPCSCLCTVEDEITKWGLGCDHRSIGYETIQSSDSRFLDAMNGLEGKKCFIVADESIFIKNEKTLRFQRLLKLRRKCEYAFVLCGTPITKSEWDIYNQMEFLSPLIFKMGRDEFRSVFFEHIEYKKKGQRKKDFWKFSDVNAKALEKIISPYVFECDLDFLHDTKEKAFWSDYEGSGYSEIKEKRLRSYMANGSSSEIIGMLQELSLEAAMCEAKNHAVAASAKGRRCIVFCNFIDEEKKISEDIGDCLRIDGSVPFGERGRILAEFSVSEKPLIITLGTGSYSLNLQSCHDVIYSSLTFKYGDMEQSKARIRRTGQENDVSYEYFLADLGINRMMLENLSRKANLAKLIKEKTQKEVLEWARNI
jgi:SNF2 family DNA or RNA helicase